MEMGVLLEQCIVSTGNCGSFLPNLEISYNQALVYTMNHSVVGCAYSVCAASEAKAYHSIKT